MYKISQKVVLKNLKCSGDFDDKLRYDACLSICVWTLLFSWPVSGG